MGFSDALLRLRVTSMHEDLEDPGEASKMPTPDLGDPEHEDGAPVKGRAGRKEGQRWALRAWGGQYHQPLSRSPSHTHPRRRGNP